MAYATRAMCSSGTSFLKENLRLNFRQVVETARLNRILLKKPNDPATIIEMLAERSHAGLLVAAGDAPVGVRAWLRHLGMLIPR